MITNNMPRSTLLCACYCQNGTCFVLIVHYCSRLYVVSQQLNLVIQNNSEAFVIVTSRRSQSLQFVFQNNTEEFCNATCCRSQSRNLVIQIDTEAFFIATSCRSQLLNLLILKHAGAFFIATMQLLPSEYVDSLCDQLATSWRIVWSFVVSRVCK